MEKALYQSHFAGKYAEVDDSRGRFIEHVLYDAIVNSGLIRQTALLPANPKYEGVSGSHGNSMARNKYKMMVRSVERALSRALGVKSFHIEY
jgi:hypothetical protein